MKAVSGRVFTVVDRSLASMSPVLGVLASCFQRGAILIGISLVFAGCSLVPGQYLGITAPVNETDQAYVYDSNDTKAIEERADIFAITPTTVAKQIQSKRGTNLSITTSLQPPESDYMYRVGPRDVLRITVWNHPELNNPAGTSMELAGRVVDNRGYFFYPYAGEIKAAGRTVHEIRDELASKLAKFLVDPQVDVSVADYRSQRVFVLGQVGKPGVVPLTDTPLTVTELISVAGGLQESADLRAASLTRGTQRVPLDLYALLYEGDLSQNMQLRPGDVLTVPENRYNKVFVLGEVGRQQSIVMPRGRLSLAEAISDAGGFNPLTAHAGHLYVIREGENQRPQIWYLNASSPDALVLADRFDLQPRDIVYVDPAAVARFGRVVNNLIPSALLIRATIQN